MALSLFDYKAQIDAHLERLKVNTDFYPYSGLMTETSWQDNTIDVFDDYARESYRPDKLLAILRHTDSASLDQDSSENIWDRISPAKA